MTPYLALALSIAVGAAGQLVLKAGAVAPDARGHLLPHPIVAAGLLLYLVSALLYVRALGDIPLSRAYPSVSLSYAAVALLAHVVFGEPIGFRVVAALGLIAAGVLLLHRP